MVWELLAPQLRQYLDAIVPPRPPEMHTMEAYARETRFPIVGPAAGNFCYLLARLIRARRIFEMGSGFGYSTAWFARAVQENGGGTVFHVVWDEELSHRARQHLKTLGFEDVVQYQVSEAVEALSRAEGQFDLIFNDIDKEAYPRSLPIIAQKLRPGGVLIVDNMFWQGRVFDDADRSATTQGVRELTRQIFSDSGLISSIVPIRDGLLVAFRTH